MHTQCGCYLSARDLQSFLVYFAQLLCRYGSLSIFQASEKCSYKLPDLCGPLSRLVPLPLIVSVLESKEHTQSERKGRYSKFSPKLKAEISRWAAELGVAATVWLEFLAIRYSKALSQFEGGSYVGLCSA